MTDSKRLLLSAIALAELAAASVLSGQALAQGAAHKDSSAVPVIDTVRVMAQKIRQLDQVGFNDRRSRGDGQYITAEEIEKRNPSRLTDILNGKRGIQIYKGVASNTRGLTTVVTSVPIEKNYCIGFQVFVDAVPMPIPFDLDEIPPRNIAGIEIYSGTATVPSLLRGGNTTCGVIALWTR